MKKKNAMLLLITLFVFSMLSLEPNPVFANESIVTSVNHSPSEVIVSTTVIVEITFSDSTNISGAQIQYCAIEPDYVCYFPKSVMEQKSTNAWEGNFTVQETSEIIGYEIIISFENESTITAPDSNNYLGYSNIAEPIVGVFYFTIDLSITTQTAPLGIGFIEIAVGIGVITIARFKNGKKRRGIKE